MVEILLIFIYMCMKMIILNFKFDFFFISVFFKKKLLVCYNYKIIKCLMNSNCFIRGSLIG